MFIHHYWYNVFTVNEAEIFTMTTDYSTLGSIKIIQMLVSEFKKTEGNFKTASHKFYTVRKKMAKETGSDVFMAIQPAEFFKAIKSEKIRRDLEQSRINRMATYHKRKSYRNTYYDESGDFDDMGNAAQADAYFERNKRRRGLL